MRCRPAAAGRPSILIPFGAATEGHQMGNARTLARAGAAVVILEKDLTVENIAGTVTELLQDRARLKDMGEKARALAKPNAARDLARLVYDAEAA